MDGFANHFAVKNALDWKMLHFVKPRTLTEAPPCLDADTDYRLPRQRSHCSCVTKRSLVRNATPRYSATVERYVHCVAKIWKEMCSPRTQTNTLNTSNYRQFVAGFRKGRKAIYAGRRRHYLIVYRNCVATETTTEVVATADESTFQSVSKKHP